jgi:hypothetical protein
VHEEVAEVAGWLEPEDTLKLYELGYLAAGPFLEIGAYRGKSAAVLATAVRDAGRQVPFYSLDIDRAAIESGRTTLGARGLGGHVTFVHGTTQAFFRAIPEFQPRFVFLDGDHSEAGLGRDLALLEARVPEGGLLLFHDFVNSRNEDPADRLYGIPQAIRGSWVARDCEFAGTFGCTGLYRRTRGPRPEDDDAARPALIELIALDRLPMRLRVNVARPVMRLKRRVLRRPAGELERRRRRTPPS